MRGLDHWTRYVVDNRYYGIAALVESYTEFLRAEIWDRFNAIFFSPFNKFLAAIEGKIDLNASPEIVKYIATTGTEGRIKPSINFDIIGIEPDETATPLFFNYPNISFALEKAAGYKNAIIINDRYLLFPQYMYVKVNLDCNAVFNSWYEKVDFEIALLQAHRGLNRVSNLYNAEVLTPLNGYLEMDLDLNPFEPINIRYVNRAAEKKINEIVYRLIYPTGRRAFHITHFTIPKITLTSLNDASEKYGSDRLPEYRTSFSVTIEDFIISTYLVAKILDVDTIVTTISGGGIDNPTYNSIISFLYELFNTISSNANLPFNLDEFIEILNTLMNVYNVQNIEELLENIEQAINSNNQSLIEEFLSAVNSTYEQLYDIDIPPTLINEYLGQTLSDVEQQRGDYESPIVIISSLIDSSIFPSGCLTFPSDSGRVRFLVYTNENYIPEDSELKIPPSFWKITPTTKFLRVLNAYRPYRIDFDTEEIIIKGPILRGFKFLIAVQI